MAKLYGSVNGQTKEVKKLYGSVNGRGKVLQKLYASVGGQTKLIYQNYGEVFYYTDDTYTTTAVEYIVNESDIASLCNTATTWSATINGTTIPNTRIKDVDLGRSTLTSLGNGFLRSCVNLGSVVFPPNLTSIGALTLNNCTALNSTVSIPDGITTLPAGFMGACTSFNQPLTLPSGLTTISGNTFNSLTSFNQPISIPDTVTSISGGFTFFNCNSMVSEINIGNLPTSIVSSPSSTTFATDDATAPFYTVGAKIAGANRAAWLALFPDLVSGPYRHLVDAGT